MAEASVPNGLTNGHTHDVSEDTGTDIFQAGSIEEIKAALASLHSREATVTARLDELVSSQKEFQRELGRLDILRAHLGSQANTTRSISNGMLSNAASTANRISSAVKTLDLEQSRVKATLDVVEQVAELKACVLGVTGSMGAPQDWETAASYLSRASKIPKEIIEGSFAGTIVPTAEVPDPPNVTLENAAGSLCGLFLREFDKAVKEANGAKITRFFKLFPLIGRSDIGLDVYGRYVCQGVAARARANLHAGTGGNERKDAFFYSNALTKLFEHIAQIIENHGGLVERHYGAGSMVKVIERLQIEADVQGGIILDTWSDERNIDRKLTDIKSYAFTFLVQSFLPTQRASSGTPRAGSPAIGRPGTPGQARNSEDEGVDMKEIDGLLNEMGVMLGSWSLYTRFLADKCKTSATPDSQSSRSLVPPPFLTTSPLSAKILNRLVNPFNAMTTFFLRRSVEKAFQLDETPADLSLNPHKSIPSNPPHITSAVDDIMYIVNKILQQTLQTSQIGIVTNVVPTLARVLGTEFIGMIQRKMRDESYPKAAIQGALPPESLILSFLVLVNNLDVATNYITRIVDSCLHPQQPTTPTTTQEADPLKSLFPLSTDSLRAHKTLQNLSTTFTANTTDLLSDSIAVVFNNIMKPRLRPILTDAFRDTDYLPHSSSSHNTTEPASDPDSSSSESSPSKASVPIRFTHGWQALTLPLSRIMTEATFNKLLLVTSSYLAKALEKRLWSYHGRINELGAVRLERDVSGIVAAVVGGKRYVLRAAFERCVGVCAVLGLEEEEWSELSGGKRGGDLLEGLGGLSVEEGIRARGMLVV